MIAADLETVRHFILMASMWLIVGWMVLVALGVVILGLVSSRLRRRAYAPPGQA
ncbi:MAG: hypothetical protein OEW41_08720 [Actinomycetota bacterium]|nr:hypothetical protein [Actinomycetota bacterium]